MAKRLQRVRKPRLIRVVNDRRDRLIAAIAPAFVEEFFRTGGKGETWDDYHDLAESIVRAVDAILERSDQ